MVGELKTQCLDSQGEKSVVQASDFPKRVLFTAKLSA